VLGSGACEIQGVVRYPIEPFTDERGEIVEVFRAQWLPQFEPVQWNVMLSGRNVLRGVRCHIRHTDLLMMASGTLTLGLVDLRSGSSSEGVSEVLELKPTADVVVIPPGVAHGLYFPEQGTLVQAVTHTWSIDDEFGCRWDDPNLGLDWQCHDPVLSEGDRNAGTLADLRKLVNELMAR